MARQVVRVALWLTVLASALALLAYRLVKLIRAEPDVPVLLPHISLCLVAAIVAYIMLRRRPA